ncbi:unnamed protein product [Pedinophyceae sp. YPF-701]|nr:unnamed protein product [Pedinophyceae sp. YPF-701]
MRLGKTASVAGLLVFGTTTSLFAKIVYELEGKGADGHVHLFLKPWAMTTVMFMGMSLCLPLAYYERHLAAQRKQEHMLLPDDEDDEASTHSHWQQVVMLLIPTAFDLVATVLMNIGLLTVSASVYQMMRGAELLFAALFAITFLGRHLNMVHGSGILLCMVGIMMVGASTMLSSDSGESAPPALAHSGDAGDHKSGPAAVSPKQALMGMVLIIVSQAVQAAQVTFEDFFMTDLDMAPLMIVGYEGMWGTLCMVGVLLPAVSFAPGVEGDGIHENSLDTLAMLVNSPLIRTIVLVDMFALLAYNVTGMSVTGHLGAVFRTVLETMRTLFVWALGLALFYLPLGAQGLGEPWTPYSWLQLAGFCVLVSGTNMYSRGDIILVQEMVENGMRGQENEALLGARHDAAGGLEAGQQEGASAGIGIAHPSREGYVDQAVVLRPSQSIAVSSFKSTMNIYSASLSQSMVRGSYMSRMRSRESPEGTGRGGDVFDQMSLGTSRPPVGPR